MILSMTELEAMGVPVPLLLHARRFVATLDLCWPGFHNPHAREIVAEILDEPFDVVIDGSCHNPMPYLDDTIRDFAALVLGCRIRRAVA